MSDNRIQLEPSQNSITVEVIRIQTDTAFISADHPVEEHEEV